MDTNTNTDADRRHDPRTKIDLLINRFLNGHPYMCRMTDISRTGARLVPLHEPRISPPPSFMGLQFQLPGRDEVVTASGEAITSAEGRAVGIRFTNLPADSALIIDSFLSAS